MNWKDTFSKLVLTGVFCLSLLSCGGKSEELVCDFFISTAFPESNGLLEWHPCRFAPMETFQNFCANPRTGFNPFDNNRPYADMQGSEVHENFFLRSWTHNFYLWYDEVEDHDPHLYSTAEYFSLLKTMRKTPAGDDKDNFHFSQKTATYLDNTVGGRIFGYGMSLHVGNVAPPREFRVRDVIPGSPADLAGVRRGMLIVSIDGADLIQGNDIETLNRGLYPTELNEPHEFTFRPAGQDQTVSLTIASDNVNAVPVKAARVLETDSGTVGYIHFNSHINPAESGLFDAFSELEAAGVDDVVLDLRYNGGGLLAMAGQVSYMVAGAGQTEGRTFYRLVFNDKYPNFDPFTGARLDPIPFYSRSLGFAEGLPANTELPSLNLNRVFILSSGNTCSASETIINGLRGIDVDVILIGDRTCGKPYGFYPQDNCGTTYFSIQFTGINEAGFGEYSQGFKPENHPSERGIPLPGCWVEDDLTRELGDPEEAMLAAALSYRSGSECPLPDAQALQKAGAVAKEKSQFEGDPALRLKLPEELPGLNNSILLR